MQYEDITYRVLHLTDQFYDDYPNSLYPELLSKRERAYNCLFLNLKDYSVCIPYRSHIRHSNAYFFQKSKRSKYLKTEGKKFRSGLDYSKLVVVKKPEYLSDANAIIDNDEFHETIQQIDGIILDACRFVDDYVKHMTGEKRLPYRKFQGRYQYSPLQYFHDILGIKTDNSSKNL